MPEKLSCKLVSWEDLETWCKELKRQLAKAHWRPDIIVGLARGGWAPARVLSDYLILKELYSVKTEHWGVTASKDGTARLVQGLNVDVNGKKVLVLDDITDTGESMRLALEHIRSLNPGEVRTATLLHIPHSKFKPDFIAQELAEGEWHWFIFPWNYHEDITNLLPKVLEGRHTLEEVVEAALTYLNLDLPREKIKEALDYSRELDKIILEDGKYHQKLQ